MILEPKDFALTRGQDPKPAHATVLLGAQNQVYPTYGVGGHFESTWVALHDFCRVPYYGGSINMILEPKAFALTRVQATKPAHATVLLGTQNQVYHTYGVRGPL